jgi:glycosyltransferase involved in cell wall biosynthesis
LRLLLVSHPFLRAELGAAQVATQLGAALRARGHDVVVWSPEPLPSNAHWWNLAEVRRRAIERFIAETGPFDAIDAPAISIDPGVRGQAIAIARSVQPDFSYMALELREELKRRPSFRLPMHALHSLRLRRNISRGWRLADRILCLGELEQAALIRRHPRWASKIDRYLHAVDPKLREHLFEVRRTRAPRDSGAGIRFLWIGRWAAHKGTRTLVRFLARRSLEKPVDRFTIAGCGAVAERDVPPHLLAEGRVRVIPSFTRAELPALLAAHDAGLFTSIAEGWGLSLGEMLESGMPVYATRAGGAADLAPYFPRSLRPFPPPLDVAPAIPGEPESTGYFEEFTWDRIALDYELSLVRAANERKLAPRGFTG